MHQQIRLVTRLSPPDLAAALQVVADAGINILAVGGSNLEHGGEFGFAVAHEDQAAAVAALEAKRYRPRAVDVTVCWITKNEPGQLLECVRTASNANKGTGKAIRDIAIGVADDQGRIPVQIFSDGPG
jgi:hypothetical protein